VNSSVDPRFVLLSDNPETAFYIHRNTDLEHSHDAVAGPFSRLDILRLTVRRQDSLIGLPAISRKYRIMRFDAQEIFGDDVKVEEIVPFTSYELVPSEADENIVAQRSEVDRNLVMLPLGQAPQELIRRAERDFEVLISGLFRYALCSMTRIVLSTHWTDAPGWLAVTTRDREKRPGMPVSVALLKMHDKMVNAYVNSGERPTSSALSTFAFHKNAPACVLLHAHLLAPVLLDIGTKSMAVIAENPRTSRFGVELRRLLDSGQRSVLRRHEGIWCSGSTGEAALASVLRCQEQALDCLFKRKHP
jgi:hypothetical protein